MREEHARLVRDISFGAAHAWYRREAAGIASRALLSRVLHRGPFYERRSAATARSRGRERMGRIWRDIRQAARALRRAPQFTVVSVLTLGLAIGANAAVFAVVDSVLLEPLPYPDSDRLVELRNTAPGLGYEDLNMSPGLYFEYAAREDLFEASGIYRDAPAT